MVFFLFFKDNLIDCFWKVIEIFIFEFKKDLDIIYKYNEVVNCLYVFYLFLREFEEFLEIKKFLKKFKYFIFIYIDFVFYTVFVNYGSILIELEYNYN